MNSKKNKSSFSARQVTVLNVSGRAVLIHFFLFVVIARLMTIK